MNVWLVDENESGKYTAVLKDENSTPIDGDGLDAATLTLYDRTSDAIINGREAQDVLNAHQVTIDANGNLTWVWLSEDMAIVGAASDEEHHVALFVIRWTDVDGNARQLVHEVVFRVKPIPHLT